MSLLRIYFETTVTYLDAPYNINITILHAVQSVKAFAF